MMNSFATLAPVVIFSYNRPLHLRETITALKGNLLAPQTDLIIFTDGPADDKAEEQVREVRLISHQVEGFHSKRIINQSHHLGLFASITSGINLLMNSYDQLIVLEDDMITSKYFLTFMNEALLMYKDDNRVAGISGYAYPVSTRLPATYFIRGADCWGWATWRRSWHMFEPNASLLLKKLKFNQLSKTFDYDGFRPRTKLLTDRSQGRNQSWAICWDASHFIRNNLTLYPNISLIRNIGTDGSGTHSHKSSRYDVNVANKPVTVTKEKLLENTAALQALVAFYKTNNLSHQSINISRKIINKLRKSSLIN
jgi:hypothetical protein